MTLSSEEIEAIRQANDRTQPPDGPVPADNSHAARRLLFTPAAEIKPERVRWLWTGRVPLGMVTLLAGRQGQGKSTLTVALAAWLSRGNLDGDLKGTPAGALIVSYEDHASATIAPRLMAASADLAAVRIVSAEEAGASDLVSLPGDVDRIAEAAQEYGARLVIVDPLVASMPAGEINAHRDQDVRRALAALAGLAEDCDVAVLAAIHFNKSAGTDALLRVSGSVAFTAAPRSVLAFGADPDDPAGDDGVQRVLAHPKCNVGPLAPSLACRIEGREITGVGGETISTSRLAIVGEHTAKAADFLATPSPEQRLERDEAAEWLADELAAGEWRPSREIKTAAKAAGITTRTLQRAKEQIGVEDHRDGFPAVSKWRLPVAPSHRGATEAPTTGATGKSPVTSGDPAPGAPSRANVGELARLDSAATYSAGAVNKQRGTEALFDRLAAAGFQPEWLEDGNAA